MPLQSSLCTTANMNFQNASLILVLSCLHLICIILSGKKRRLNPWIDIQGFPWSKSWLCITPHLPLCNICYTVACSEMSRAIIISLNIISLLLDLEVTENLNFISPIFQSRCVIQCLTDCCFGVLNFLILLNIRL